MVRIIGASLAAITVSLSFAVAQIETAEPASEEAGDADPAAAPISELDALSRTTDDPFTAFERTASRKPVSVTIRALNKITARYRDIEAPIEESVKFGSIEILPRFCDKRPPEEFPETTAFLEVFDRDLARARGGASVEALPLDARDANEDSAASAEEEAPVFEEETVSPEDDVVVEDSNYPVEQPSAPVDPDRIFSGWMFASSPALNALEHPVYDVWVIDCKTVAADS